MSKNYNFCNNCGKSGHPYHLCKLPITSIGVVTFKPTSEGLKYLMIRRKNTLGFVDFMRGKFPLYNKDYIMNIIDEMTIEEKNSLITKDFEENWINLWGDSVGIQYRGEEKTSLEDLIKQSPTSWKEPEWGFPKGRRNYQEKDIEAAIREWEEETGYSREDIKLVSNIIPFEEIFTGSNNKSYKHKYYIALFNNDEQKPHLFQESEVSAVTWESLDICKNLIRPYNLEKKNILNRINKVINEYRLYQ